MKTIIILGTARGDGNTFNAIEELCPFSSYKLIDLGSLKIDQYSYNQVCGDDFLKVAEEMANADVIIFATPVYWYSMSAVLKIFFDRLTDLLFTYKHIGKSLKGKKTYLIATGSASELPKGFEVPFLLTSEYCDMTFENVFYKKY